MKYKIVSSILGIFLMILSFFLSLFFLISIIIYPEEAQGWAFLKSFLIVSIFGLVLFLLAGKFKEDDVSYKEVFAVIGIGWIIISFFGALPGYFSGDIPYFTDAYFESMSGFTTTGASILENVESFGKTVLLWRSFTHWLGGMGFIILSLAILPALGIGGMQLYIAEVPGSSSSKLVPRIGQTAQMLYIVFILISLAEVMSLRLAGMSWFESFCHSFGTMGTGGFSPLNDSIGQYAKTGISHAWLFEIIICIFMFIAGSNFSLHSRALKGNLKVYLHDPEFKFYVLLIIFAVVSISCDLFMRGIYASFLDNIRYAGFSVVSIVSTTGFVTADFNTWPEYSKYLLFFLTLIGASAGSAGGGIKILRIMTLVKQGLAEISHIVHPKKIYVIRFGNHYISREVLYSMNTFMILYMACYVLGILALSFTGLDMQTIATMVAACFSNVGTGFGKVGPTHNFGFLPDYAKWILSCMMVLGRLEIFPILVLSLPGTWTK
ncbi:MAG: TrkH family potassium uptake protein [Spirochaetia bacterium]|nr:TrkH family potassium uptake protein [Spirochaetia bacterium]